MFKMSKVGDCCVPYCSSKRKIDPNIQFHSFPPIGQKIKYINNKQGFIKICDRRYLWTIKLKINKQITKCMKVCSRHFTIDDYEQSGWSQRNCLQLNAVPSQFLPGPYSVSIKPKLVINSKGPKSISIANKFEFKGENLEAQDNLINKILPSTSKKQNVLKVKNNLKPTTSSSNSKRKLISGSLNNYETKRLKKEKIKMATSNISEVLPKPIKIIFNNDSELKLKPKEFQDEIEYNDNNLANMIISTASTVKKLSKTLDEAETSTKTAIDDLNNRLQKSSNQNGLNGPISKVISGLNIMEYMVLSLRKHVQYNTPITSNVTNSPNNTEILNLKCENNQLKREITRLKQRVLELEQKLSKPVSGTFPTNLPNILQQTEASSIVYITD